MNSPVDLSRWERLWQKCRSCAELPKIRIHHRKRLAREPLILFFFSELFVFKNVKTPIKTDCFYAEAFKALRERYSEDKPKLISIMNDQSDWKRLEAASRTWKKPANFHRFRFSLSPVGSLIGSHWNRDEQPAHFPPSNSSIERRFEQLQLHIQ